MIQRVVLGKAIRGIVLTIGLCLLAVPADAGRGFGGGGGMSMGGGGTRGGFHGGGFHKGSGFHGHSCCANGFFVSGFVFGSFPTASYYDPSPWYPVLAYPQYAPQLDLSLPAVQPQTQLNLGSAIPREACYATGCYRLEGDGVTVAYQWIWVPAPPPPPAVIPYPTGRYELRGPSRWEWVPNSSSGLSIAPAATPSSKMAEPSAPGVSLRGLFRWTDENGVTHWTQGLEAVPERYRPRARPGAAEGVEGTL